jgi:hypothetical protein
VEESEMRYYDPVVEEVRTRGRQLTARLGNDPKKILKMLQERAKKNPEQQVSQVRVVASAQAINE